VTGPARTPYPGLRSFRREETDLFFGREDCIHTMVDRLAATRFLAVLGSSGTGKSSIVKTGLLDALDLGVMAQAGSAWRVVDFRPGGAPLRNLARRLLETEALEIGHQVSQADVDLLRAFFARGPRSVVEWCADGHLPNGTNLLLLVDQFEELFRYRDYAGREEAEAFAALLIESARNPQFPIYVTLTMRSEYLGACALVESLAETISAGLFLTPRMTREQCRAAIVGPAMVCGIKIDDALTNRLLNDLATFAPWDDRLGGDQLDRLVRRGDQLPLLQYCLNRMWIRARDAARGELITLTQSDYEAIGRLGGALNAQAGQVLDALGDGRRRVAEATFRALTDGTTVADAVRRPTRFGELVGICGGDETAVRAVVDAFRAPGCNFLVPELDPRDPQAVEPETFIDISHESLIRQWRQLSEWLEKEARSVRQWRRLKDRFEDNEEIYGTELANMLAWRKEEKPNAAWGRRHDGDYAAIMKFLDDSQRRQRRFAPIVLPGINLTAFLIPALFLLAVLNVMYGPNTQAPWQVAVFLFSESAAITCAFALGRYAGLPMRRAALAGAIIFILNFAGALATVGGLLASKTVASDDAQHWWVVLFFSPCTLMVLAIFEPVFRRVMAWLVLVALYVGILRFQALLRTNSLINNEQQFLLFMAIWLMWFAAIGYLLRRGAERARTTRPGWLAHIELPLACLSAVIIANVWGLDVAAIFLGPFDNFWVNYGIFSAATAFTCAYGLSRYDGLGLRQAVLAGTAILAAELIGGSAVIGAISHKVALAVAFRWWVGTLYAPLILVMMAVFAPTFRRPAVWLSCVALLDAPYAVLLWLSGSGVLAIPEAVTQLVSYIIWFLWFAAIGYHLRRRIKNEQAPPVPTGVLASSTTG
jgi:hypothetical protein